jgi:hypothetical protein
MSKILTATCDAQGKVTADSVVVDIAQVLSEGKQASSGILIIDGNKAWYMPSSATDIKTSIEKLIAVITDAAAALTQVGTTLTSIGAGMTGPTTAPPGTLATDVVNINSKVTALNATKAELETLKGALK